MALRHRLPPVLRRRDYALYMSAILPTAFSEQMVVVAVGWQVYAIHRSALDLGLIGLAAFVPLLVLALPAGELTDRVPRTLALAGSLVLQVVVTALLLLVSLSGARELWPFLALAAGTGTANALGAPAGRALPAILVPLDLLEGAITLRSIAYELAVVAGPALGGLLFAISPETAYGAAAGLAVAGLVCVLAVREPWTERSGVAIDLDSALAGIRFIRDTPVILGSMALDLFAVLFGGALALLPLFARSVLDTGPVGLGLLRSAPSVGGLLAGLLLARRSLGGRIGRTLLVAVAAFGGATVVFGLSHSFALSCVALAVAGFVDMFSVNIRATALSMATPDELRGRVMAVEWVFISGSNELGAFESGVAAALLGAVKAVVAGGVLTIGLALAWPFLFPGLSRLDRYEDLQPGSLLPHADRAHPSDSPA